MIQEITDDFSRWRVRKDVMAAMDRNRDEWGAYTTKGAMWAVVENGGTLVKCGNGEAWLIAQKQDLDLVIVWSGGTRIVQYLPHVMEWAEDYARRHGAARIVMSGRKAWERLLRPYGFYLESVTMAKELDDVLQDA